jgi:hypothetical protein
MSRTNREKIMLNAKAGVIALALSFISQPAMAGSFITDEISNPSTQWSGIDYWGVQVSQFSVVDQLLTFNIVSDSKIDIFMGGSPRFQFTDLLLNGASIATGFTVNGSNVLKATGYAAAGAVSLRFKADYSCANCWGDWFGGYVQVTSATLPTPPATDAVPEPSTWAMMIAGMGVVGASMRRRKAQVSVA